MIRRGGQSIAVHCWAAVFKSVLIVSENAVLTNSATEHLRWAAKPFNCSRVFVSRIVVLIFMRYRLQECALAAYCPFAEMRIVRALCRIASWCPQTLLHLPA